MLLPDLNDAARIADRQTPVPQGGLLTSGLLLLRPGSLPAIGPIRGNASAYGLLGPQASILRWTEHLETRDVTNDLCSFGGS